MAYQIHLTHPVELGGCVASPSVAITKEQYDALKLDGLRSPVTVTYSFGLSGGGVAEGEVTIPVSNIAAIVKSNKD